MRTELLYVQTTFTHLFEDGVGDLLVLFPFRLLMYHVTVCASLRDVCVKVYA